MDDYKIEVKVEEDPKDKVPPYSDDSMNLVEEFSKSKQGVAYLKKISTKVDDDFRTDWEDSSDYREKQKANWKIFAGDLPEKDWPFEDSANPHIPLMLENLSRLCFRA